MTQPKKKQEPKQQRRARVVSRIAAPSTQEGAEDLLTRWQQQIESLTVREFRSLPEAIDALITEVVASLPHGSREEEREFLQTLFEIDPELQSAVERSVKIARQ